MLKLHDRQPRHQPTTILQRQFTTGHQSKNQLKATDDNVAVARLPKQAAEKKGKQGFRKSERAAQAAEVNLSAKLSQEGKGQDKASFAEIQRLIRVAKPEIRWLALAFALLVVYSSATMAIPYAIGKILDVAATSEEETRLLGLTWNQFLIGFTGLLTLGAMANYGSIILLRIIGERVIARLRSQLYRRTYMQDAEFFDANRVGDLISRLNSDTVIVGKSITQNMSGGISSLFVSGAGLGVMVWSSVKLTGLLLLLAPPDAISVIFYGHAIRNVTLATQKNLGTLTKIVDERLGNVRTSQALAGELQEVRRYNNQLRQIFSLGRKESRINANFSALTGWAADLVVVGLLVVGGNLVRSGAMSVGDLTSFMLYAIFTGSGLYGVSGFYSELMKGAGAASRLFELQDRRPGIYQTTGSPVKSAQGLIKFNKVSFAYPTRPAVRIFDGLDFDIPSGSNVCVVGPSGGGKSTVATLLLRFYNPTSGSITINGVDITKMNAKSLRRRIGIVSQEPVLFSSTIAENIAYGRPKASYSEIVAAAKRANCTFISDLPDGLETQVGARGSQLSGGQKQRIAIARALLKDPDILILDEATSALDAQSEALVNEALAELLRGHNTTISIAHRLSTIQRSDQIIVLNGEGQVAEIGSYTQLAADEESAFSKLMERQMSGRQLEQDLQRHEEEEISEAQSELSQEVTGAVGEISTEKEK